MKYEVKTKKLPKSEVEIEISLPSDFLVSARKKAIEFFKSSLEISGFRKGHVPENIINEKIGEKRILEEASNILLKEHFHQIIIQEKFDILGSPKISVTKLALNNPFEFKAVFAVMPEFELPEYKNLAANVNRQIPASAKATASEEEIAGVLLQIRKNKAHLDWHKKNPETNHHNHPDLDKEENLPPLTDDLAKEVGNFKNLEELKEKIKENIIVEKKQREIEKKRAKIIDSILEKTKIDLPEILVLSEINKSLAQIKDDVERTGRKFEDYLAHIKKDEKELKEELRESSEKKARVQLIFNKIAIEEKIEPNKEILENEVKHIMQYYKDASEESVRVYVSTILINQEVLKLLEQQ